MSLPARNYPPAEQTPKQITGHYEIYYKHCTLHSKLHTKLHYLHTKLNINTTAWHSKENSAKHLSLHPRFRDVTLNEAVKQRIPLNEQGSAVNCVAMICSAV